jgi:REP element-mobilizing transposase RayT
MMPKHKNLRLFNDSVPRQFGGSLLKGNPRRARPLSTKHAIHLVLKSQWAYGEKSLLHERNCERVTRIVHRQAKRTGVRIYHFVNVGNHLHLVIRIQSKVLFKGKHDFHSFIRAISGLIARQALKAERNSAKNVKFWVARPFTRLISWGIDYNFVTRYMGKNRSQAQTRRAFVDWGFGITDPQSIVKLETG